MTREDLTEELDFHREALKNLRKAYLAISAGGATSYGIGTRTVTKQDLSKLSEEMKQHKKAINDLELQLSGASRRKAVGIILRDW